MENLQPKLRFPNFHNDWKKNKLGEIASFYSGGTPLTSKRHYFDGNIPFIRSGEINSYKTEQFISEEGLKNSSSKMVNKGDLLYALYGATSGEVGISQISGAINQAILCIKSDNNLFFLASFLRKEKENIIQTFLQGGQGNLSADIVKKLYLYYPSIEEQTKIANFLTSIDDKINLLKEKKSILVEYKKGIMKQIFSQEIRFKDGDNDFANWEVKKLGDVGSVLNGLTYSPDDIVENGVLVLRSSNIKDGRLKFDDNVYVSKEGFTPVKESDILICVRNGSKNLIGKNTLITKKIEGVAFGAFMSVFRSEYNNFLIHWFGSEEYFKNVNINLGATINSINGSDLKKFKVPIPCIKEQSKIANFLSSIDEKIEIINIQIEETQEYNKGLLQQMII